MTTTEGISPYIQRTGVGSPVEGSDLPMFDIEEMEKMFTLVTKGMFDKGKLFRLLSTGKTYMIQQPMESYNID